MDASSTIKIRGEATVVGLSTAKVNFGADIPISGFALRKDTVVFAHWEGGQLSQFVNFFPKDLPVVIQEGKLDLQTWLKIHPNHEFDLSTHINLDDLVLKGHTHTPLALKKLSGLLKIQHKDQNWTVTGTDWNVQESAIPTSDATPALSFKVNRQPCGQGQCWDLYTQDLALEKWTAWLEKLDVLPKQWDMLKANKLWGNIDYLKLGAHQQSAQFTPTTAHMVFSKCSVRNANTHQSIGPLSGTLSYEDHKGKLLLNSKSGLVDDPRLFLTEHRFHDLSAFVVWEQSPQGLTVQVNPINITLEKAHLSGSMALQLAKGAALPWVEMMVHADPLRTQDLLALLPRAKMSKDLLSWLDKSILGGTLENTTLLLRGNLADFPFKNREGNFEIATKLTQGQLHYAPNWPTLENLHSNILFQNQALHVNDAQANFDGGTLLKADAVIPDLTDQFPHLSIQTQMASTLQDAMNVLQKNPQQAKLVKTLSPLTMQGPMTLALGLEVPLSSHSPLHLKVRGALNCDNDNINFAQWNLPIGGVRGEVLFTENSVISDHLQGTLLGAPTQFQIRSKATPQGTSPLTVQASGRVALAKLQSWLKMSPSKIVSGESDYQAQLTIDQPNPAHLKLTSMLSGIAVTLPAPFAKEAKAAQPLEANLYFDATQLAKAMVKYGDDQFNAHWDESARNWNIHIIGENIKGLVRIPTDTVKTAEQPTLGKLFIDLEKLNIVTEEGKSLLSNKEQEPLARGLDVHIKHLVHNKKELSNVRATVTPSMRGVDFSGVRFKIKDTLLQASGRWDYLLPSQLVVMDGKLITHDSADTLRLLGFKDTLVGAKGKGIFTLQWQGTPSKIDYSTLVGTAEFKLKKGVVRGVNTGIAKLLNILSLETVQKRLSFDFSDLTKSGLHFDELKGKFQFGKGKISTNKVELLGPSANILFYGQANSENKNLDAEMVVMPNITGSLPVAAAIAAANPAVGAAVWLVDKVVGKKIQEIHRYRYRIRGTFDAPVVTPFQGTSSRSGPLKGEHK
jgi:uncharacterized protein YhdP